MLTTVPLRPAHDLDTPVSELMHEGLVALPATASLADAAATIRDNRLQAVLVTDLDGIPLGWVTSNGILNNHPDDWTLPASAEDAITESAASVEATATLGDAMTLFVATGASRILVESGGSEAPVGVLTDSDLVAFMAA